MTWQRIDENTYIDDTLVTCAEYQLFIDEMHEQGKYYQPDHWASYQFPKGQALKPILGIRQSDAVWFHEWLTTQEGKKWKFRLPTQTEANSLPMKNMAKRPLGYWLSEKGKFAWIGEVPQNTRSLDHSLGFETDLDLNLPLEQTIALALGIALNRELVRPEVRDFDLARDLICELVRVRGLNLDFSRDISSALDIARSFANVLAPNSLDFEEFILEIYSDIITLQERIAGRSPAFEGIRLVKERIK
jgi:hypothetical protein